MPGHRQVEPQTPPPHRWPAHAWALGAAGIVFAARLHEIRLHTGDVPINDQWQIEAADVIAPWLDGTLGPGVFFNPHFEHVPAFTRLLAWLQVMFTGRWDPFIQATVNALLFSGFIALVARWTVANLRPLAASAVTALLVFGACLPHDWENITWGFQSQFPCALLGLFLHVHGSFAHSPGTRGWWWAQAAGAVALFTLAGMWIAPLAILLASLWAGRRPARSWLGPLAIALAGVVMLVIIRIQGAPGQAFVQTVGSPLRFLYALCDLLGWPAGWPGALALTNLPFLFFALQLRGRRDATTFDLSVLALGLWATGQAAALAYARNTDYGGYVSRYGELLAVLVLANSLAFARLFPATGHWRPVAAMLALGWAGIVIAGQWELSTGGHTAYFHEHAAANARRRREAVQAYLQKGDRSQLEQPETRRVLYQGVDLIAGLLDRPGFRALLPTSVNPLNPPDLAGTTVRALQANAFWLGSAAGAALLAGIARHSRQSRVGQPATFTLQSEPLLPWIALPAAIAAGVLVLCWPDPFVFNLDERWRRFFQPPGSVGPLSLEIVQSSRELPGDHLFGAAPLSPPGVRFQFYGTNPGGLDFTGTTWSQPFPITTPWIVVPLAGFPVSPGNGLRLRIENSDGRFLTEVSDGQSNPQELGFWNADVRNYQGKQARLVLYDGRTDAQGWVAAAPPIATNDPDLAAKLAAGLEQERLSPLHYSLARLSVVMLVLFGGWLVHRRMRTGNRSI